MAGPRPFSMQDMSQAGPERVTVQGAFVEGQSILIIKNAETGDMLAYIKASGGDDETPPQIEQQIFGRLPTDSMRRVVQLVAALNKAGGSHEDFAESFA